MAVFTNASSPSLWSVGKALPKHYASQESMISALRDLWSKKHFNIERLEDLHRAVKVSGRFLALPIDEYAQLDSFGKRNDAWIRVGLEIGEAAVRDALRRAGLEPRDVDHIFSVTVTGIAAPSLEARLVNRIGLRSDIKRTPIFGLGCVAGAAGVARASDYVRAFPNEIALLLSVELCSLSFQREDVSIQHIIGSGLFGDGAAAVVCAGANRGLVGAPRVMATRSVFYPDTERMMGWDIIDTGFKLVLSGKMPNLVRDRIQQDVDTFLTTQGLRRTDIAHWVAHTGGPKVLQAFEDSLELPPGALELSWKSLSKVGNLSSASILFVLNDFLESKRAKSGDYGLMIAMGPGFCAELVLLQW